MEFSSESLRKRTIDPDMEKAIDGRSSVESSPCKPCKKVCLTIPEVKNKFVFGLRMNGQQLFKLILENHDPQKWPVWSKITHLFFDGLVFKDGNSIAVGSFKMNGRTSADAASSIIYNAGTYVLFLREIKQKYPHLRIIWCLQPTIFDAPLIEDGLRPVERIVQTIGWRSLILNINRLADTLPMDGVEINGSVQKIFNDDFVTNLRMIYPRLQVFGVLPYEPRLLQDLVDSPDSLFQLLLKVLDYVVIPSYGHFTQTDGRLFASDETSVEYTNDLVKKFYTDIIDNPAVGKLIMGIDTLGTEFDADPDTKVVKRFRLLPRRDMRIRILNDKNMKARESANGCTTFESGNTVLSFDTDADIKLKIDYINYEAQGLFNGTIVGEYFNDPSVLSTVNERLKIGRAHV